MRWPYILSLFFLAGATLLLIFNILCGATTHSVIGKWYWLEADTSSIPGAPPITRWTNYASCGIRGNKNNDCSSKSIAYPMSPVLNFGTTQGVPSGLSRKRGTIYFLTKVGWVFLLIGLIFTLMACLPVAISFCVPSFTILNVVTSLATNAALCFAALSAALLTAGYIKARDAFKDAGSDTSVGKTMFAFIWTSVLLLFLSSILSGAGCLGNFLKKRKEKKQRESDGYETDSSSHNTYGNNAVNEKTNEKGGFFSRKKKSSKYDEENVRSDYLVQSKTPNDKNIYNTQSGNRLAERTDNDRDAQYDHAGYNANTGTAAATAGLAGATVGATALSEDNNYAHSNPHEYTGESGTSTFEGLTSDHTRNNEGYSKTAGESHNDNGSVYAYDSSYPTKGSQNATDSDPYAHAGQKYLYTQGGYTHDDTHNITGGQTTSKHTAAQFINSKDAPNQKGLDTQYTADGPDSSKDGSANQGLWSTAAAVLGFGAATTRSEPNDTGRNGEQTEDMGVVSKATHDPREAKTPSYDNGKFNYGASSTENRTFGDNTTGSPSSEGKQTSVGNGGLDYVSNDLKPPYDEVDLTPPHDNDQKAKISGFENKSTVLPVASTTKRAGYNYQGGQNNGEAEYIITDSDYNVLGASHVDLTSGYEPTEYYASHVDGGSENAAPYTQSQGEGTASATGEMSQKNSLRAAGEVGAAGAGSIAPDPSSTLEPSVIKSLKPSRGVNPNSSSNPSYDYKQNYLDSTESYSHASPSTGQVGYNTGPTTGTRLHDVTEVSKQWEPEHGKDHLTNERYSAHKTEAGGSNNELENPIHQETNHTYSASDYTAGSSGYGTPKAHERLAVETNSPPNSGKTKSGLLATLGNLGASTAQPNTSSNGKPGFEHDYGKKDEFTYEGEGNSLDDTDKLDRSEGGVSKRLNASTEASGTLSKGSTFSSEGGAAITTRGAKPSDSNHSKSPSVSSDSSFSRARASLLATTLGYIGLSSVGQNDATSNSAESSHTGASPSNSASEFSKHHKSGSTDKSVYTLSDLEDVDTTSNPSKNANHDTITEGKLADTISGKTQKHATSTSEGELSNGSHIKPPELGTERSYPADKTSDKRTSIGILATTLEYIGVSSPKPMSPPSSGPQDTIEGKARQIEGNSHAGAQEGNESVALKSSIGEFKPGAFEVSDDQPLVIGKTGQSEVTSSSGETADGLEKGPSSATRLIKESKSPCRDTSATSSHGNTDELSIDTEKDETSHINFDSFKNTNPYREERKFRTEPLTSNLAAASSKVSVDKDEAYRNQRIVDKQTGAFSLSNNEAPATPPISGEFAEPSSPTSSHYETNDLSNNYRIAKGSDGVYGDYANPRSTSELEVAEKDASAEKGLVESVIERAKNII